jgi:hypothetical protein
MYWSEHIELILLPYQEIFKSLYPHRTSFSLSSVLAWPKVDNRACDCQLSKQRTCLLRSMLCSLHWVVVNKYVRNKQVVRKLLSHKRRKIFVVHGHRDRHMGSVHLYRRRSKTDLCEITVGWQAGESHQHCLSVPSSSSIKISSLFLSWR